MNTILNGLKDLATNPENYGNRMVTASLPFLNFYSPFHGISSKLNLGASAFTVVKDIASIEVSKGFNGENLEKVAKSFSTVLSLVGGYQLGLISTGTDVLLSLKNGEYYQAATQGFRFAIIVNPVGLELKVAYVAMQILLEVKNAYHKYNEGRKIETFSNLALASLRAYGLKQPIAALHRKWTSQPSTVSQPSLVNKCSGQLTPEQVAELEKQFEEQEKSKLQGENQYLPQDDEETAFKENQYVAQDDECSYEMEDQYLLQDDEGTAFREDQVGVPTEINPVIASEQKSCLVQITLVFNRRFRHGNNPPGHSKCDRPRTIKHKHHGRKQIRHPEHLNKKQCHPKRMNISKVNCQRTQVSAVQHPRGHHRHHRKASRTA